MAETARKWFGLRGRNWGWPSILLAVGLLCGCTWAVVDVDPLQTPYRDPLVPTPRPLIPSPAAPASSAPLTLPVGTAIPASSTLSFTSSFTSPVPHLPAPYTLRWRMGVAVPDGRSPLPLAWPATRPGWYLNWSVGMTTTLALGAALPAEAAVGMAFAPLVWVDGAEITPAPATLATIVQHLPGRTWLIGNEPDVKWQGNATPDEYAQAYHLAYTTIKAADPTAQVAIGGLSQITPLRLAYLDAVWAAYARRYSGQMPVDVWTMHAFVLPERRDDWGVDIPPGIDPGVAAHLGMNWEIDQHDDLGLVEQQIRTLRAWMVEHDQQAKPLWITEYGVLMPAEYGFDSERVRRFMLGSFDLLRTLRDPATGFSPDDHRLVQRWVWFSTDDVIYPTGNLFSQTGEPTLLLDALSAYLAEFGQSDLPK